MPKREIPVSSSFSRVIVWTLVSTISWVSTLCVPEPAQESAQPAVAARPLITQPTGESNLTMLKSNTHPLARSEFDQGTAPASLPMNRMLLVLKRSYQQETALRKLLDDQQDKTSLSYHKWLTPDEFGKQFGPTDGDMSTVTKVLARTTV